MDESGSDESERDHPDDTDVGETDLGKTEWEKPDDTDVKESDSGDKDEGEDEDHHIAIIPRNDPQNSYKIRSLTSYFLRNHNRKPTLLKCRLLHAFCMTSKRNKYNF